MPWGYMQLELHAEDALLIPMIGPDGMTREQAHAEIQSILDRVPRLAPIAQRWRAGAPDDTVFAGPFTWAIYEYPDDSDAVGGAAVWLDDYANTMRSAGLDVGIAQPRQ